MFLMNISVLFPMGATKESCSKNLPKGNICLFTKWNIYLSKILVESKTPQLIFIESWRLARDQVFLDSENCKCTEKCHCVTLGRSGSRLKEEDDSCNKCFLFRKNLIFRQCFVLGFILIKCVLKNLNWKFLHLWMW